MLLAEWQFRIKMLLLHKFFDEWAENRCINPSETNFSELRLNLDYYLPKEKYKKGTEICFVNFAHEQKCGFLMF